MTARRKVLGLGLATVLGGGVGLAAAKTSKFRKVLEMMVNRINHGGIVVHHSATPPSSQSSVDAEVIAAWHKKRGMWMRYKGKTYNIAYHYVILPDGTVEEGRPLGCLGMHTRSWFHNRWVGVCLVGYFDKKWLDPKYHAPTGQQMDSLVKLTVEIAGKYGFGPDKVLPHRAIDATQCPGRNFPFDNYMARVAAAGPSEIS